MTCDNCGRDVHHADNLKSITLRGEKQSWCTDCVEKGHKGQASVDAFKKSEKPMFSVNESWKVEVIADNSGTWATNAMRYSTKEKAMKAGESLFMRWTAVREWRVTETPDPINESTNGMEPWEIRWTGAKTDPTTSSGKGRWVRFYKTGSTSTDVHRDIKQVMSGEGMWTNSIQLTIRKMDQSEMSESTARILVKIRQKDFAGAEAAFTRLMQEKVNRVLVEERRAILTEAETLPKGAAGVCKNCGQYKWPVPGKPGVSRCLHDCQAKGLDEDVKDWQKNYQPITSKKPSIKKEAENPGFKDAGGYGNALADRKARKDYPGRTIGAVNPTLKGLVDKKEADIRSGKMKEGDASDEPLITDKLPMGKKKDAPPMAEETCPDCDKLPGDKLCPKHQAEEDAYQKSLKEGDDDNATSMNPLPVYGKDHRYDRELGESKRVRPFSVFITEEKLECQECGKVFNASIGPKAEPKCPKCHSTDVELKEAFIKEGSIDLNSIRPGDRVTIHVSGGIGRNGIEWKEATGKAVMRGPAGWVLNMGGKYGTPGVATPENIVRVGRSSKGLAENAKGVTFHTCPECEMNFKSTDCDERRDGAGTLFWKLPAHRFNGKPCPGSGQTVNESYGDGDDYERSQMGFRDPGGKSALRKGSRIYPCPTCKRPNMLTAKDKSLGYQCDRCADADEGIGGYGS